ncbi:hypothetical protein [Sphingomonas sp. DT-204]|uniref:hypothetical protein n=1 Tax=Sphingomonas sp. DT-204 TaxID=3396166 RepID=UPI003F1BD706
MKFKLLVMAMFGLFGNSAAVAADSFCGPATISEVLTYSDGSILIFAPWRGSYTMLCNVQTTWKGITPNTCFAWFSTVSTAVAQQKPILVFYYAAVGADCATMPNYANSLPPGYIKLAGN